jgi:glycosyltransferase involved in cell wall biosynthesis
MSSTAFPNNQNRRFGFLVTRWNQHAKASGYHPICDGLGPELSAFGRIPSWADWFFSAAFQLPRVAQAANVHSAMRRAAVNALFVLSGEDYLKMSRSMARLFKIPVAMTFHLCPDTADRKLQKSASGWIDLAIVVSRCQMPLVKRLARNERCRFVPHGVNTDIFRPGAWEGRDPDLVLSVGHHRRDLHTLCDAARLIRRRRPSTRVILVAPRAYIPGDADTSALEIRSGISDAELIGLYQQAAVLLLPLQHATANNSLLEAMAAGMPLVATDIGGVSDYITPQCAWLSPPADVAEHARLTLALLDDADKRRAMSAAAREHSLRFAWPLVREQFRQALAEIH